VFSTDKPQTESINRVARIRTRIDAANYIVDPGDGTAVMAYHAGPIMLERGQEVVVAWANEGGILLIRGLSSTEEPVAPLQQQQGITTPIDNGGF